MAPTSSTTDVSKLISQLRSLNYNISIDEAQRTELISALKEATWAIETPLETVKRLIFTPLELSVAKVAVDLNLFDVLVKSSAKSVSSEELAQATGSKPALLVRLLRYLASIGLVEGVAEDQFAASKLSKSLAHPGLAAGISHSFGALLPCYQVLPTWLADNGYDNPSDNAHCGFQVAFHTDLPAFVWAAQQPAEKARIFALWMQANKEGLPTWLDKVPFKELCGNTDPETPIFVDIGGSIGHQSAALKAKYPDIPGRVIYQDIAPVIAQGLKVPGVEPMIHDFWEEQPIKGARIYYFRNIMHDYPDERCATLLKITAAAMNKKSCILIDELILSDFKANSEAAGMDLSMMLALAGAERTDKQWHALVDAAGLEIKIIYTYDRSVRQSVLVLVPK